MVYLYLVLAVEQLDVGAECLQPHECNSVVGTVSRQRDIPRLATFSITDSLDIAQ